ncbi:hypothetical protein HI914_00898 [Erysiphe necator]|nr:hypothetical protein HI914_00898 [Erysiphe necator]
MGKPTSRKNLSGKSQLLLLKQRVSIAGELAKTASEEVQHIWTDDEIVEVLNKDEPFNSRYHPEYRSDRTLSFHSSTGLPEASRSAQLLASMIPNMSQVQTTEPVRTSLFAPQVKNSRSNPSEYILTESQNSAPTNKQYQRLPQQLEEQKFEDYYQNLDISKQKEPVAPFKYRDIPQYITSYPSNIPPLQQSHYHPPHPSNNLSTQQQNIPLNFNQQRRNNNANKSHAQNQYLRNNAQSQPPQNISPNLRSYSEEMKYKGADDCLNLKLQMFYDLCSESGVLQNYYRSVFPIMLTGEALTYYYSALAGKNLDFDTTIQNMRSQYETEQQQQKDFSEWSTITLAAVIANNTNKSIEECLNLMTERLRKIQSRLDLIYQTPKAFARSPHKCFFACYNPAPTLEAFCAQLQSSIATALEVAKISSAHRSINQSSQYMGDQNYEHFFTDRRYHGGKEFHRPAQQSRSQIRSTKKSFVCKRIGCWSSKHSQHEKEQNLNEFCKRIQRNGLKVEENLIQQYIVDYEGQDTSDTIDIDEEKFEALMVQLKLEDNDNIPETSQYMTAYGEIDGFDAISQLHDQSIHHALAAAAPIKDKTNRYNSLTFQGIMIDIGAAQWSTVGEAQVRALQKLRNITIDSLTAGKVKIIFGIGATTSLGTFHSKQI